MFLWSLSATCSRSPNLRTCKFPKAIASFAGPAHMGSEAGLRVDGHIPLSNYAALWV